MVKECPCCKEKFVITLKTDLWIYKIGKDLFCSYKCYSKEFDKEYKPAHSTSITRVGWKRGR